jgi:hypothetical protein
VPGTNLLLYEIIMHNWRITSATASISCGFGSVRSGRRQIRIVREFALITECASTLLEGPAQ